MVTASSGNHGQAIAWITGVHGVPCTVVMPEDAVKAKENAARGYGAEVVFSGTLSHERITKARELAEANDLLYLPGYDHYDVIAGQGTIGLELLEQVPDVEAVLVPVGGGGLISGIATAIKEIHPQVKVFGVEPQFSNSMYLSLQNGRITARETIDTISDGLRSKQPGALTFSIVQNYVDEILVVSDAEIKEAMRLIMQYQKQVIEPSGATAPAAALFEKLGGRYKTVAAVISGGNVDFSVLSQIISHENQQP